MAELALIPSLSSLTYALIYLEGFFEIMKFSYSSIRLMETVSEMTFWAYVYFFPSTPSVSPNLIFLPLPFLASVIDPSSDPDPLDFLDRSESGKMCSSIYLLPPSRTLWFKSPSPNYLFPLRKCHMISHFLYRIINGWLNK